MLSRVARSQVGRVPALRRCLSSNVPAAALEHEDTTVVLTPGANAGEFTATPVSDSQLLQGYIDQQAAAVLAEEDDTGSYFDAIGLTSGFRYAPLIGFGALTCISNEWYVMNEETIVAAALSAGGFVAWLNAREPFMEWYNSETKAILDAQTEAEQKHVAACQTFVSRTAGSPTLEADLAAAFAERADLVTAEIAAKAYKEKVAVRNDFVRRLEAMVNQKADEENRLFKELLAEAEEYVAKAAEADAFKKEALAYAISAVADPKKAGSDPAGKLYSDFFASKGMSM